MTEAARTFGMADPALRMLGGMVEGLQATGKKLVADGIASAMRASDDGVMAAVKSLEAQVAALAAAAGNGSTLVDEPRRVWGTPAMGTARTQKQGRSPAELVDELTELELHSFAALADAPPGVAEFAFATMPQGMRTWAETYDLVGFSVNGDARLTPLGRQVLALAAGRCPEPFSDLSTADISRSSWEVIDRLPVSSVGMRMTTRAGSASRRRVRNRH